jgi:hypothetical protein
VEETCGPFDLVSTSDYQCGQCASIGLAVLELILCSA